MDKMTLQNTDAKAWYLSNFDFFESKMNGQSALPFHETRRAAISRFAEIGFPTARHEEWKYTNLAPVLSRKFKLAQAATSVTRKTVAAFLFDGLPQNLLVFVNGQFSQELSAVTSKARGLVLDSLAGVLARDGEIAQQHLTRLADYQNEAFVALNTAFTTDGAFVRVPRGLALAEPIHILHISDAREAAFLAHPRNLFIAGEGSEVQIIESYHSATDEVYFNNIVSEIVVEDGARVEHVRIQNESRKAYHVSAREVQQGRDSNYSSISIDLGGALVRNNFHLRLNGENCEGNLYGFYFASGGQLVDNHTLIDHAMPHCQSNEHYKGILDENGHGVFNGKVMVRPDAQKTNAYQSNQCLLLSDEAVIDTKPQLEIFADDVKCSHGASVGQLDDDAVFYLRSRGLSEAEANSMLRHAYAGEILNHVKIEAVRTRLDEMMQACFKA
jgi:Fe-S cluster assembly protein SufD